MTVAFGNNFAVEIAEDLATDWTQGNFQMLPEIELRSTKEINSAFGAFCQTTNKIYLAKEFLQFYAGNIETLSSILLEEIGHYIDTQINQIETPGDEGAIFSALVRGEPLNEAQLESLRAEDDWATILLDGQLVQIEQANFVGTNGNDTLPAGGANNSGDDIFYPLLGEDVVNGGTGIDQIVLNLTGIGNSLTTRFSSNDRSSGFFLGYDGNFNVISSVTFNSIERFNITGTNGSDYLYGAAWNDTLVGGFGNDTLDAGTGNDQVDGGENTDRLVVNYAAGTSAINFVGSNNGTISSNTVGSVTFSNIEEFDITATALDDNLTGWIGNDRFDAGAGNNIVNGNAGVDTLFVNYATGSSAINFTASVSGTISTNGVGSVNYSNIEQFHIIGTGLNDTLIGGTGNDTLDGNGGTNTINGNGGIDRLVLNFQPKTTALNFVQSSSGSAITGNGTTTYSNIEEFTITGTKFNDTIKFTSGRNIVDGAVGIDVLSIDYSNVTPANGYYSGISTSFSNSDRSSGEIRTYNGANFDLTNVDFSNIERFNIIGTSGNDQLYGAALADTLSGGAGNDTLEAGAANDSLNGDTGNDYLNGATGNDTINGGTGTDTLALDYTAKTAAITFVPASSGSIDTGSGIVTFSNIEQFDITASAFDDTINFGLGQNAVNGAGGIDLLNIDYSANTYGGFNSGISTNFENSDRTRGTISAFNGTTTDRVNFSNIERFKVTGTASSDQLAGAAKDDTLIGGSGDDSFDPNAGNNTVDGGTGIDQLFIDYSAGTSAINLTGGVSGTFGTTGVGTINYSNIEAFDVIGTSLNDTLIGGTANDKFDARGGNNTVDGTTGVDRLVLNFQPKTSLINFVQSSSGSAITGNGTTTYSNIEEFTITGTNFADSIKFTSGRNIVDGAVGADLLIVDYSANTYSGFNSGITTTFNNSDRSSGSLGAFNGSTDDSVDFSNIERFNITGTTRNDDIYGAAGNDTLSGGAGDDTLEASAGNDSLVGGDGNDSLDAGAGTDTVSGGVGTDTLVLDYSAKTAAITFTPATSGTIDTGSGTVTFSAIENFDITASNFADTINFGLGQNAVDGGAGSDLLVVDFSANTYAYGGISTDFNNVDRSSGEIRALNNSVSDRVDFSNIERFKITGTGVNDEIYGAAGSDTLNGGAGNDTLDASSGADTVSGGTGIDTLVLDYSAKTTAISFTPSATGIIDTGSGTVNFSAIENFDIIATDLNDTINFGLGQNAVDGGVGTDLLVVDFSANTYAYGGISTDFNNVDRSSGEIRALNNSVSDRVDFSNIERFKITGTGVSDEIYGAAGSDTLNGGAGNDTLDAGTGADTVSGGTGIDTLVLDYSAKTTAISFIPSATGTIDTGSGTVNFSAIENFDIIASDFDDTINFGLGQNAVDGGVGNDLLVVDFSGNSYAYGGLKTSFNNGDRSSGSLEAYNGSTDDQVNFSNIERFKITGTGVSDEIYGAAGSDTLTGGAGNDTLDAGTGTDTVSGGTGIDTLLLDYSAKTTALNFTPSATGIVDTGSGTVNFSAIEQFSIIATDLNDTINFKLGENAVDGGAGSDLLVVDFSGNSYAYGGINTSFSNGDRSSGEIEAYNGSTDDEVNFSNIERFKITGTGANDEIYGAAGSDTLTGGAGDDTLDAGTGTDTVSGGTGTDTLLLDASARTSAINFASASSGSIDTGNGTVTFSAIEQFDIVATDFDDTISFGLGDNTVDGSAGSDVLVVDFSGNSYSYGGISTNFSNSAGSSGYLEAYNNGDYDKVNFSNIERFKITGTTGYDEYSTNDTLVGGAGYDTLIGLSGNDILAGGGGNDSLTGGGDADQFVYNTNTVFATSAVGIDLINDFTHNIDVIVLDKTTFTSISSAVGTGFSLSSEFAIVTTDTAAATSSADIVYNSANGNLFYNPNGAATGFGTGAQFATLIGNPTISATDFYVQS
ncbi:MAG TPA: hypothetical protein V6D15_15775 [Oculatellaceae cyanobacterium]